MLFLSILNKTKNECVDGTIDGFRSAILTERAPEQVSCNVLKNVNANSLNVRGETRARK